MNTPQTVSGDRRALGGIFLVTLALFWPTLVSFPPTWNASYQEHGFFVGALVLWLVWRDRRRILRAAGEGMPDLLLVLTLLSVAWLFAVVMNVRLVHQLLFTVIVTAGALTIFGWRARRIILATAATFLLAVPFWSALMPSLQRMTVIASGGITTLAGIEAEIGYDYISISTGTFLVEEGCSGINYLMGGLVLGAFYAHLFTDRWQTQLKIIGLAGAMSIVGNWIRVAALIFLGEATAMQSPYIEDHLAQGWAIFTLLMIPTYFLVRRIERRDARRAVDDSTRDGPVVSNPGENEVMGNATSDDPSEPFAAAGYEAPWATVPVPILRTRAVRTAMVVALGPLLFVVIGAVPRGDALDRTPDLFAFAEGWTPREAAAETDGWTPDFHGIDDRARWRVVGPAGTIHATRYYFRDQRQGEELIQYNNRIAADSLMAADRIIGPIGPERRFVHEAVVRDPEAPRVLWYWYRVAGFDTPFETKAKLLEVLAFFVRSPAAELVVLEAVCDPYDCTEAGRALRYALGVPTSTEPVDSDP